MKPHRLTLTNHLVLKYGLHQKMEIFQPRKATDNEILEFHAADYVDFLKRYVYGYPWRNGVGMHGIDGYV